MAFTSIAALVGGAAASTTLVLGAIAEVGMAMSVVGAVTGNKKLMKVGAVLGIVGGVGGMISKAAAGAASTGITAGAEAAAAGEAAGLQQLGEAGGYGFTSTETGLQALGEAGGYAVEGVAGGTDLSSMAEEAIQELGGAEASVEAGIQPGVEPPALNEMGAAPAEVAPIPDPVKPDGLIGEPPAIGQPANTAQQSFRADEIVRQTGGEGTLPGMGVQDYFKNFLNFVKDNKEFSKMAFEGLKGLATANANDAQEDYYRSAAEANRNRFQYGNTVARYQPLIGAA